MLTAFRQRRDIVGEPFSQSLDQLLQRAAVQWHGVKLDEPDWRGCSHAIAFTIKSLHARLLVHAMFNAYWEPLTFELPPAPAGDAHGWRRCIDTSLASPDDIWEWERAPAVAAMSYVVQPRSVVLLARGLHPAQR